MAVDSGSVDAVEAAISSRGTPVEVVGTVSDGTGVYVDGDRVQSPDIDPSWQAFRELSRRRR
jgi:hydrogenase expression/formation protein HypE